MDKNRGGLVVGVGIDMVSVSQLRDILSRTGESFIKHTFTPREQEEAAKEKDPTLFYAGRFAVKEAVFKATAPLLPGKSFDFRMIETLREADGSPQVNIPGELKEKFMQVGIDDILVSISHELDIVIAIAEGIQRMGLKR